MIVKLGAGIAALFLLASCGGGGGGETAPAAGGDGDDSGSMTLTIESPSAGEEVSTPFTIEFASSEEIGPSDTGAFHVHVYFDGNEDDYEVVEATSYKVSDLPSGEHEIYASLRNADHSETGVETEVAVTVSGAGAGGDDKSKDAGGGYDY